MLVIELNEFEPNFLKKYAKIFNLKNIIYFLELKHSETYTEEKIEHHGLDPWVQWVSIHNGIPFSDHQIGRLGQTKMQNYTQIWNKISKIKSLRWGVWGAMNSTARDIKENCFFLPDPWSFEEKAYPSSLNKLLSLPRYVAKNYLELKIIKIINYSLDFLVFVFKNTGSGITIKLINKFMLALFMVGINIDSLTTLFDYVNCLYFIKYKKRYKTEFSLIFLNHIAHLQHKYWNLSSKISKQMKFGLIICNEVLGELKNNIDQDESIVLLNGLKQKNVYNKQFYVYRQKNPKKFFNELLSLNCEVEQNMTNDGTLIFEDASNADKAESFLKRIRLKFNKSNLLYLERISSKRLFYQIELDNYVANNERIIVKKREFRFFDYVEILCQRTGAHIPYGDIYYKNINFPKKLLNHEVFSYISSFYN